MPRLALIFLTAALVAVAAPAAASAADATADFEGFAPGTTITNQYADLGGPGQGVTFGPLPGAAGDGFRPIVLAPPVGQANSGTHVGDVSVCNNDPGCLTAEFFRTGTTGTFLAPHKRVSVRIGLAGQPGDCAADPNTCADPTLTAYDANGAVVGTPQTAHVKAGDGFHTLLSIEVPTATIRGFSVDSSGNNQAIAIDDVSWDIPDAPPPPDFTLTPRSTFLVMRQGETLAVPIAIAHTAGSSGDVNFTLDGPLPKGVHASFEPNPANGDSTVLTFTTDPDSDVTGFQPVTLHVTGTPASGDVGSAPRDFDVGLQVRTTFDLTLPGTSDADLQSCVVKVPVQVGRDLGFTGPVSLSVSGATGGVTAHFEPGQITFPDGGGVQTSQLVVTGPATGKDVPSQTLTVTASAPGLVDKTVQVTVHGACPAQYDARVTSLEITQGAQSESLPVRDPSFPNSPIRYAEIPNTARLRTGAPTIVRVYANLNFGPLGGVSNVPALLYGAHYDRFGQQKAIPGGPLSPVSGPRHLDMGGEQPTAGERASETAAYTFVLPPEWTNQKLAIGANLAPSLGGGPVSVAPCDTVPCKDNDHMSLTQIPFAAARGITIRPLNMTINGVGNPDPSEVFKWARMTDPLDMHITPYGKTIDITDLQNQYDLCVKNKGPACGDVANEQASFRVLEYACSHKASDDGNWVVGVNSGLARGLQSTNWCSRHFFTLLDYAVVSWQRPLTSVAHELGHLQGRPHADTTCGGDGESWPPDKAGHLNSIGVTTTLGTGVSGGPLAVIGGGAKQWYDFMSYCANANNFKDPVGNPNANAWISVKGWNEVMGGFAYGKRVARPVLPAAQGPARPSLHVAAVSTTTGTSIVGVEPVDVPAEPAVQSDYHLLAFDAAGRQIADVPMLASGTHIDGEAPQLALDGVVPVTNVARVAVVRGGATVAELSASPNAPAVVIHRAPSFRGRDVKIPWHATDKDRDRLVTTVDYSTDGGRTYDPIFTGPDRGVAHVPFRALPRSSRARVRVRVNDGFHETAVESPVFVSPGAPPVARIDSPVGALRQPNDAPLALLGEATDDRDRALTGRHLRWLIDGKLLGTGEQIAPMGLPAGHHLIVLEARDSSGRVSRAGVPVTLTGARPLFLTLSAPSHVKKNARVLRVRVVASVRSSLTVSGAGGRSQRFSVDRHRRTVTVRLKRGAKALHLRFALKSGQATSVAVARR